MMRRILGLLMAITMMLGILPAQAETVNWQSILQIKQDTPAKWQQTYETPWRTISINADVTVPDVDAVPIFRVTYQQPQPKDKLTGFRTIITNSDMCFHGMVGHNPQDAMDPKYSTKCEFSDVTIVSAGEVPNHLPENNPLTYTEARQIADKAFRSLYGYGLEGFDDVDTYVFSCMYATSKGKITEKRVTDRGYYWLRFKQSFAGISMEYCDVYTRAGGRKPLPTVETLIEVTDAENYTVIVSTLETKDQPYADVPLRSFTEAKAAYEGLIMSGYIREIKSVKLCYAPYHDPKDSNVLWLIPVWYADCVVDESPEHEAEIAANKEGKVIDSRVWSEVVFEAQRGTVMNPLDSSKTRRDAPAIVTWEDAKQ